MTQHVLYPRDLRAEQRWSRRLKGLVLGVLSAIVLLGGLGGLAAGFLWWIPPQSLIRGVIWQPSLDYPQPEGQWQQIGADTLVVQWLVTDDRAWRRGLGWPVWDAHTKWPHVQDAAWAKHLVLGLAGNFSMPEARMHWRSLAAQSTQISERLGFRPQAWYAPIEISPDWTDANAIRDYLRALPRPLWVSVYRADRLSPEQFAAWVHTWLPKGVGVLFEDGVGVGRASPNEARRYARALVKELGRPRVGIVLEAFRTDANGQFIAADFNQIQRQLAAYRPLGIGIYVFSCRYLGLSQILLLKFYAWLDRERPV